MMSNLCCKSNYLKCLLGEYFFNFLNSQYTNGPYIAIKKAQI